MSWSIILTLLVPIIIWIVLRLYLRHAERLEREARRELIAALRGLSDALQKEIEEAKRTINPEQEER